MQQHYDEWARCRPWIEAALPYCQGTHTIEDIEAGIARGDFQFWPGERCAVITEVNHFPRLSLCNYFLVGGDLTELIEQMEPVICAWARTQGCTRMTEAGRRGWEKPLGKIGYRVGWTVMMKDLANE